MKNILITIAAVVLVGCGGSQQSAPAPEVKPVEPVAEAAQPKPPTAKAPDISIHDAARKGNIEAVKQHLDAGGDVDAKDKSGQTPLHRAAAWDRKEVAELLIAKGADLNAKIESTRFDPLKGYTPLDVATLFNLPELASILRKHGGKRGEELENAEPVAEASKPEPPTVKAPDFSINDAARIGDIEAVKQHLNAGADVNAKDRDGWTPLHEAAATRHTEIVKLLIAKGADVNAKDGEGKTPLDRLSNAGVVKETEAITKLLRKHGGKSGKR